MDEATRWYTWKGNCVERIRASEIKSHAAAVKLGPFVDENVKPVLWVGWGRRESGKAIPPYFRHWPRTSTGGNWCPPLKDEIQQIEAAKGESESHRRAKQVCVSLLSKMIAAGEPLPWAFKDAECSDFSLSGNLLADAVRVQRELSVLTPFAGERYRFDVGLLGNPILKNEQCLVAIEFELTNRVGIWKTAICRTLGFPLITIDLAGIAPDDITEDWCRTVLTETTHTSDDGRRRNYFSVHTMLYPTFLDIPVHIRREPRHRFVVFADDRQLRELKDLLHQMQSALALPKNCVLVQSHPNKNAQTQKQMEHEGSMAGHDWRTYNDHYYLRVSLDVPVDKAGPLYRLHLAFANLLTCRFDCLVGYKYDSVVFNTDTENPTWLHKEWRSGGGWSDFKVGPKHLSQPIRPLRSYLALLTESRSQCTPLAHAR